MSHRFDEKSLIKILTTKGIKSGAHAHYRFIYLEFIHKECV